MLETSDIQGLVLRGYGKLAARFLLLEVTQAEPARGYLRKLCGRIDRAHRRTGDSALQVAFTAAGLEALEVPDSARQTFAREFVEGMADEVRAKSLGDDPSRWKWPANVHVLLMIYAHDHALERHVAHEKAALAGLTVVREQHTPIGVVHRYQRP